MGLRCLFGHDFGEPQTSREREERGDEAVVTVKEYKECRRCGRRRLLSENTEVTSTAEPTATDDSDSSEPSFEQSSAADEFEDITAEEDDGVILEDEPEGEPDRQRGEWPDDADTEAAASEGTSTAAGEDAGSTTEWPDAPGEDEGYSAEPGGGGPAEDVEFSGGLTPERTGGSADADEGEYVGSEPETGSATVGFEATGPSPDPTEPVADDVDTDLVCARCGHLVTDRADSFRPGDVCPECRSGYLAEQVSDE